MKINLKLSAAAAGGIIGGIVDTLLGGWCYHMTVLVILMCIDFLMGLLIAVFWKKSEKSKDGCISSMACWKGIVKKVCTLMIVAVAYQLDRLIGIEFAKTAVIIGFCVSEVISILENAQIMDLLPESVKKIFDRGIEFFNEEKKDDENKK